MKKTIELLAPAGDYKSFVGAINAGANAVYISGKNFGARKFAHNFTKEEIKSMIRYAHIRNVSVFVTLNTLIFEDELESLFAYADFLVSHKVDALIIQDLGIIEQFVLRYPQTEIHASTQMNSYNVEHVRFLKSLGVARVILARETSIKSITDITNEIDIDLEVFVHGALCVSYSGNCLLSFKEGGRSGNRGECAQPCRLPYSLYRDNVKITEEAYLLSNKDLMTLAHLEDIIDSGVMSLKIEGRMKKAEYVAATVRAYREAIDHILEGKAFNLEKRSQELAVLFNRQYSKGYILDELRHAMNNSYRPNHIGIEVGEVMDYNHGKTTIKVESDLHLGDGIRILSKNDFGGKLDRILKNGEKVDHAYPGDIVVIDLMKQVHKGDKIHKTQDRTLEDSLAMYLEENHKLIAVKGRMDIHVGETVKVSLSTGFSKTITVESDFIVPKSKKQNQDSETLKKQFDKFGNTHYYLKDFIVSTKNDGFIPNSVLNDIRRKALLELEESIIKGYQSTIENVINRENDIQIEQTSELIVKVETEEQLRAALDCSITELYYSENLQSKDLKESYYCLHNRIWTSIPQSPQKLVIRDFAGLFQEKESIVADRTLNVTNHYSLYSLYKRGVRRVSLSEENTVSNIALMIQNYKATYHSMPNLEIVLYGKTEVMLTKYCPISTHEGVKRTHCDLCEKHNYSLSNTKGERYRIIRDGDCNVRILNSKSDSLFRKMDDFLKLNISNIRLDFTDEDYKNTKKTIELFQSKYKKIA